MRRFSYRIAVGGVAAAMSVASTTTVGVAAPAVADVAARNATEADLVVHAEQPNRAEMERQFVAIWSPKVPFEAKVDASYNGETARPALAKLFAPRPGFDYLTLSGRAAGPVRVKDVRARAPMTGVMVGVPVSTFNYHYLREDGRWKFDWKRTCQELKCRGNLFFGY